MLPLLPTVLKASICTFTPNNRDEHNLHKEVFRSGVFLQSPENQSIRETFTVCNTYVSKTITEFAGDKPPHLVCMDNAEKYGSVFSLRLGQQWTVVLNGSATIKEALLKKGVEFANRPTTFTCKFTCLQVIYGSRFFTKEILKSLSF